MCGNVAACCSVLQRVAMMPLMKTGACIKGHIHMDVHCVRRVAVHCSVLAVSRLAMCCSVLQCVAVCESIKGHAKFSVLDVR